MKPSSASYRRFVSQTALLATLLAIALLVVISSHASNLPQKAFGQARRAIVISLDGLDARYLNQRDQYGLKIPTLRRLMSEGTTARGVVSVYPSLTYPAHTTIVTGVPPARHGIFANDLFEPPDGPRTGGAHWFARDIKADTLWDAAARKGLSTGLVSWPVAGGAGDFNVPEIWKPGGSSLETRAAIAANARPQGLVEEVERRDAELYRQVTKDESDDMRTRFAEYIIREKRPQLMLIHLFDLDHCEHDYGPFTPEAFAMLEKVDGYVGRILAAAERAGTLGETAVFIVSDHGFRAISKQIQPGVILAHAGLLKTREEKDAQGRVRAVVTEWRALPYVTGGSCAIILRDPHDRDALTRALFAFKDLAGQEQSNPSEKGRGLLRIIGAKEVAALGGNTRAAFMLEAAEGYSFGGNYTGEIVTPSRQRGTHGYLPQTPDYHASFIAAGAGIAPRETINIINMTDIGPIIARALGLTLRDAEKGSGQ
jgi:predicted AlkP superfamily pyrophosphatase or phosphodiesterase